MTSSETVLNNNSVKIKLHNTPLPHFIVLASSVKILEVKAIEFHRIAYISAYVILCSCVLLNEYDDPINAEILKTSK